MQATEDYSAPAPKKKGAWGLQRILIIPYVALILALVAILAFLAYDVGSVALKRLTEERLQETVSRIGQAIERHMLGSGATLEAAFPTGLSAPDELEDEADTLTNRFWVATTLHRELNHYVYFGNQLGQFFGLNRLSLNEAELRVKYTADAYRTIFLQTGISGTPKWMEIEPKFYDPRIRPWYQAATREKGDLWTSVYVDFKSRELVATRARQILSIDPKRSGVVATDVSLKTLNDFMRTLQVSNHGIAFIVEPNGDMIASSVSNNVKRLANGDYGRLNARESNENTIKEIYLALEQTLNSSRPKSQKNMWVSTSHGDEYLVGYGEVRDQAGLNWVSVVAIPKKDMLGGLNILFWRSLIIGLLALLLSVLIGYAILSWVSRDMRKLSVAAKQIGQGDWEQEIKLNRNDEIGVLAQQMEQMRRQLQTDKLTGLPNRAALERRLNKRIKNRSKEECLLLLIDIDLLKVINAQYGYHTGDQILQTLAERLKSFLTPNDYLARFAGDEFALLLDLTPLSEIEHLQKKIVALIAEPIGINANLSEQVHISVCTGCAHYPSHAGTARSLIKYADQMLYLEKAARK